MMLIVLVGATLGQLFAQAFIDYSVVDVLCKTAPFKWLMRAAGVHSAEHFRYKLIHNRTLMVIWNIMWMIPIGAFLGMGGLITGIAGAFGNVIWGFITHVILRKNWEKNYENWSRSHKIQRDTEEAKNKIRKDILKQAKKQGIAFDNDKELDEIINREFIKSKDAASINEKNAEETRKKADFKKSYSYQPS